MWKQRQGLGTAKQPSTSTNAAPYPIHSPYYCHLRDKRSPTATDGKGQPVKFRCERDVLAEALGTARRAVASRGTALPVLSGVRMELAGDVLRLTGTDLDLTIQVQVTVSGQKDGVAVLPAQLASDIVRSLEGGSVHVETTADEARISGGRSNFGVRTLAAEEFPKIAEPAPHDVRLDAAQFGEALRQVVRAASTDEARPILTGVRMEQGQGGGLRLVATDSYRLAVRDLAGADVLRPDQKVLVPSKALNELVRVLGGSGQVSVRLGERDAAFETTEGVRLTTRLIEGEFPNYRNLIPSSYPNRLTVGREPLLDAIRRVKLLARDATPIRLGLSGDGLELSAVAQDVGQANEQLDASYEGADLTVAFNPDYLSAGVEAVAGDEVVLQTLDALKPAVITAPNESDYLYLLMPVRVS
jgi:DNA polymerase-3 subunit beta